MSNEKRQTRLLPFRLRRANAMRHTADDINEGTGADAELSAMLRMWNAPQPETRAARARLLADFRQAVASPPLWRRALTASVRVPLPVAACALIAMLASLVGVAARNSPQRAQQVVTPIQNYMPVVRVVEVPVVQQKVVTRVVYLEKKERDENSGVPVKFARNGIVSMSAREMKPVAGTREMSQPASFVTRVDMDDFRPADEMKIRVIKKGNDIEK